MHIAHLARAENELLAFLLEDKFCFVFREHVRGAVVLLRQLLLPFHHFAGEANNHVVLICLSVNRDGSECGAFDLHGLTPCSVPAEAVRPPTRRRRDSATPMLKRQLAFALPAGNAHCSTECAPPPTLNHDHATKP